jgi:molecular chaperone GrpE
MNDKLPMNNNSPDEETCNGRVPNGPQMISIPQEEVEKLKGEVEEQKDKYLRLLAESENMRKRLNKERQEMIELSKARIIADFLGPIDHMENALNYAEQTDEVIKHWSLGFQMILTQFKDVLAQHGVQAFVSVGTRFDPHFHEAVEIEENADVPPNTVLEEFIKGYKMGDRVIRPSRVKVSASAK